MGSKNYKYQLKVNDVDNIEELLQNLHDEVERNIRELDEQIQGITNLLNLNNETSELKVKYAKSMNDFMISKDKNIGRKIEIAKLLAEIYKIGTKNSDSINSEDFNFNWDSFKEDLNVEEKKGKKLV